MTHSQPSATAEDTLLHLLPAAVDHAACMLTRTQLAERWQCSVGHLANLASADRGPTYIKLGSTVRYRMADVSAYEKFLEVRTAEAAEMGRCA